MNRVPNTVTVLTKLNFKTGRAAHVAWTLLHESDILEAREENAKSTKKGKEVKALLDNHRELTAMLNFRAFGCRIGEDSLQARLIAMPPFIVETSHSICKCICPEKYSKRE